MAGGRIRIGHTVGQYQLTAEHGQYNLTGQAATLTYDQISDGSLVSGSLLTLDGASFGTRDDAAPILFDRIDTVYKNGTASNPYNLTATGAYVPIGSSYVWGSRSGFRIEDDIPYASASRVYMGDFSQHAELENATMDNMEHWPEPTENPDLQMYYGTWKYRANFNVPNGFHKLHRIWDSSGDDDKVRVSWDTNGITGEDVELGGNPMNITANTWHRLEVLMRIDVTTLKTWRSGTLTADLPPGWHLPDVTNGLMPRQMGLDMRSEGEFPGGANLGYKIWMADIWMDRSARRIEFCSSSTYNAANAEPQLATSWSSSSVTVRLNQGSLPSDEDIYGFVMNEMNEVAVSLGVVGQF